jgi:anti-sigma B factor antagonist
MGTPRVPARSWLLASGVVSPADHGWAVLRLLLVRYGARVHEFRGGNSDSELDARGPAAEQVVRIDTGRVVRGQVQALVVAVAGEIDLLTVERLCAAVAAAFDELQDGEILVVDLTDVTFLGSPGLQALVDVTEAAKQRREPLRIVVDHTRPVIHPIQITGLGDVLALFDTIEQALQPTS